MDLEEYVEMLEQLESEDWFIFERLHACNGVSALFYCKGAWQVKYYLNQNTKLKQEDIYKFSLPVLKTCPQAKDCKTFCYGLKGHYKTFKTSIDKAHQNNFRFSKTINFSQAIELEIHKRKIKTLRLHDTGDFYSQEYLDKWYNIAKFCHNTFFYAYTKSLHLDFTEFLSLPNTKIIQSFGGKLDSLIDLRKPHSAVFNKKELLEYVGYVDCSNSDRLAIKSNKIGLLIH